MRPRGLRWALVFLAVAAGCERSSPVTPALTPTSPSAADLDVSTASLKINLLYNGEPVATPAYWTGGNCIRVSLTGANSNTFVVCGSSATFSGLALGSTTVTPRYYASNGAFGTPVELALTGGTNEHTVELSDHLGIITGEVLVDGNPATNGYLRAGATSTSNDGHFQLSAQAAGKFEMFVPKGTGTVRYLSSTGSQMVSVGYTVAAGGKTAVGTLDADAASLKINLLYNGEPVQSPAYWTGGNCFRIGLTGANSNTFIVCGSSATFTGLAPGSTTATPRYYASNGAFGAPVELALNGGTNEHSIELSDHLGIITGDVLFDGSPATNGYLRAGASITSHDGNFQFSSQAAGKFEMFVPKGTGMVRYISSAGSHMASVEYTVAAGQTTAVGTLKAEPATLKINLLYNGEPVEKLADWTAGNCIRVGLSGANSSTQIVCGPTTTIGALAPGSTTATPRYYGSGMAFGTPEELTLAGGLNEHTIELGGHLGIITGKVMVDGVSATNGYLRAGPTTNQYAGLFQFSPKVAGTFKMFVPAGSGTVRYHSVSGALLASAPYNVEPGHTAGLGVLKQNQTIIFGSLPAVTYGDAPFQVSVSATSGLPVTLSASGPCTLSGTTLTITGVGSCTLTANQAGSENFNPADETTATVIIAKAPQTIDFPAPTDRKVGDPPITVSATGGKSNNPVTFSSGTTSVCTVSGSQVTLVGSAGTCNIIAQQAGNENYLPAEPVSRSFAVEQALATITLGNLAHVYDGSPKAATASTDPSGLTVAITYNGSSSPPTNAGSYAVIGKLSGGTYSANDATGTLVIAKADQKIEFAPLVDRVFSPSSFGVVATASSGLAVSFTANGSCSVNGQSLTMTSAGTCTVTAAQPGDGNYNAASPAAGSFQISKAPQTISFAALPDRTFGDGAFPVSATASSGLSVALGASGQCTVSSGSVTLTGAGSCTITASQGGNGSYEPAAAVARSFVISKGTQMITMAAPANRPQGSPGFSVNANGGSSGEPVRFASQTTSVCTVTGSSVTLTQRAGTCTIAANQAGNENFHPAPELTRSFQVTNVAPSVSLRPDTTVTILQGETYTAVGSFTDPGQDEWSATVNYGDGGGATALALSGKDFNLNHRYSVAGTFGVVVLVNDGHGAVARNASVLVESPLEAVQGLIQRVKALNAAGKLANGETKALLATLEASEAQLKRGNRNPAGNQVEAFTKQVSALQRSGRLSTADAQALIQRAEAVVRSIRAS